MNVQRSKETRFQRWNTTTVFARKWNVYAEISGMSPKVGKSPSVEEISGAHWRRALLRVGWWMPISEKSTFPMKKISWKKIFFTKFIFSWNIAQALLNAVLVMHIDHWVMEDRPLASWANIGKSRKSWDSLLFLKHFIIQTPISVSSMLLKLKIFVHRFSPETTGIMVLVLDTS